MRVPVEYDLGPDLPTLRGVRVVGTDRLFGRVMCLHDVGRDLDELGPLPDVLAGYGFFVEAVDLPGHGLSDGEEGDLSTVAPAVGTLVARLCSESGPVGLVAVGSTATIAATIGGTDGVHAQVVVNPVLDDRFALEPRARSTRLVVHGENANLVGTTTQRYFSHVLGEKLLVYNPAIAEGAAAVGRVDAVAAHVALFFRRYLLPGQRPASSSRPWPADTSVSAPIAEPEEP